jgi:hypothetical protein
METMYLYIQLLVTDQIRDAITAEAVSAAFAEPTDYVDFQNWKTLKKNGRIGYVSERAFENAQIIMESAREICSPGKYNSNC